MESQVEYRPFREEDYTALAALWLEGGLPFRPEGRDSREAITSELSTGDNICGRMILAFSDQALIGSVLATHDGRKGWINRLCVAHTHRGKGVGMRLIQRAEEHLRSSGINIIGCLIEKGNNASMTLFKKAGYHLHDDILYLSKRENQNV